MANKAGQYGPNIIKRDNTYYAILYVPKVPEGLKDALGRTRYTATLGDGLNTAQRRAPRLVAAWRDEIAVAIADIRKKADPNYDPNEEEANWFRDTLAKSIGKEAAIKQAEEYAADDLYPTSEFDDPVDLEIAAEKAKAFVAKVEAIADVATGLHRDAFIATLKGGQEAKSIDDKVAAVNILEEQFSTLSSVTKKGVQEFVNKRLFDEGKAPATLKKSVSGWRSYWTYLKSLEIVPDDVDPFAVIYPPVSKKSEAKKDKRQPFNTEDVPPLWVAATAKGDDDLADLIKLGAYTGARIEELCALTIADIDLKARTMTVEDAKSDAGNRVVPIHRAILPVIKSLIGQRNDPTGRLLAKLKPNKYGDYSNAIGKRFGRLKKAMGYDGRYVFHSLRKTVTTQLRAAGVAHSTIEAIQGWVGEGMVNHYAGDLPLRVRADGVSKISYP
jgi:integrase